MQLFKRFKKSSKKISPRKLKVYIDSTSVPESRSIAFVLGIMTLLLTLLIAGLITFGVRTTYRAFFNGEDGADQTTANLNQQENEKENKDKPTNQEKTDAKENTSENSEHVTNNESNSKKKNETNKSRTVERNRTMPNTGDNQHVYTLPNTGDPGR